MEDEHQNGDRLRDEAKGAGREARHREGVASEEWNRVLEIWMLRSGEMGRAHARASL